MAEELFSGAQEVLYIAKETEFASARKVTGAEAMRHISMTITPTEEREPRPDKSGSPDHLERYVGRHMAEFEITALLVPNGSATTEPDDTLLMENALGRLSLGATSLEYLQATAHTETLTIRRAIRTGGGDGLADWQEHIRGAIVNRTEISWGDQGSNGLAQVTYSGMAKEWGYTGNSSLAGDYASTGNTTCTVENAKQFTPYSLLKIGEDTAGGSGIRVSAVNYTNNQLTFLATLDATHSAGDAVVPYNPTATTNGSPIHARICTLSLDGSASQILHLGGRITYEDNRDLLNEEAGNDSPTRVLRTDRRNVTYTNSFLIKKDEVPDTIYKMRANVSQDIQVNVGNQANETYKLIMPNFEPDMSPLEVPDQDMMRITTAGRAVGNNGNDSLKVRIL